MESAIPPNNLYFAQGPYIQMLQERHIPTSDDKPTPLRPIPANSDKWAGPEQPTRAETDHSEPLVDVPGIEREATPVRKTFYIRTLDTLFGLVFAIGLFVWKYALRGPIPDKARKRPNV